MLEPEDAVHYLFGDSTESKLDFDYLAFLREVIDCAVVMLECEMALGATIERRRTRQTETEATIAAIDEFGRQATQLVGPVAEAQAGAPVGRCAAAVAAAIKESVEREAARVRGILAGEREELDREDQRIRGRAKDALEKLLRAHDLPDADQELEVVWVGPGIKASMRERSSFGVEAVLSLDVPATSLIVPDLRVDRVADGVEVHTRDAGGWLKKSDKLVAHKLGRYQVIGITVGAQVTVRLRAATDTGAAGLTITAHGDGELAIEPSGDGALREVVLDDRARPALKQFVDRLEAAVRGLREHRGRLVSLDVDGKPVAEHDHPRILAERLVVAIAPTVHRIAKHSRSPGELVLRRMLGDNRREEIFVSVPELVRRYQGLPDDMRDVFAPLQLGDDAPPAEPKQPPARPPDEVRPPASRTSPPPLAAERSAPSRTSQPLLSPDKSRPIVPAPEPRRSSPTRPPEPGMAVPMPMPVPVPAPSPDLMLFEDDEPTMMKPLSGPTPMPTPIAASSGIPKLASDPDEPDEPDVEPLVRKRPDDAALARALDTALDADEGPPPVK